MTQMTCSQCDGFIHSPRGQQKFCSPQCRGLYFRTHSTYQPSNWDRSPRTCEYSGVKFTPNSPNQKYAERHYAQLVEAEKRAARLENGPRGFYVYAWYDGDTCFYIGKGKNERKDDAHIGQLAGRMREEAKNFRCEVVLETLTETQAFFAEKVLIAFCSPAANVSKGYALEKLMDLTR